MCNQIKLEFTIKFNLSIEALPYKLELMPFEKYKLYKGLSVLEPNEKSPIRQYMPKVIDQSDVFSKSKDFKPGFLPQAEEFLEIVGKTYSFS